MIGLSNGARPNGWSVATANSGCQFHKYANRPNNCLLLAHFISIYCIIDKFNSYVNSNLYFRFSRSWYNSKLQSFYLCLFVFCSPLMQLLEYSLLFYVISCFVVRLTAVRMYWECIYMANWDSILFRREKVLKQSLLW